MDAEPMEADSNELNQSQEKSAVENSANLENENDETVATENVSGDFSSENFKIELQNLPKYFGMGQIKKLINNKLKLNANKLKPCGQRYMFVCFRNNEDKEKALAVLDGFVFKGNKLKAVGAKAASDPYKAKKALPSVIDTRPVEVRLGEAVCPYAKLSYEEQLEKKLEDVVTVVKRIGSEIGKTNPDLTKLLRKRLSLYGTVAQIQDFLKSPVIRGYRNKCEFSIGYMNTEATETEAKVTESSLSASVGFRLATYKQGSVEVVSLSSLKCPEDVLPHISPEMIEIGVKLEQFVRASNILPYNSLTNNGNWRNVMIRSSEENNQLMVVVVLDPKDLDPSQISQIRSDLVTYFTEGSGSSCKVTNLFLHLSPAKKQQGVAEPPPVLLYGEPVIVETLFNLSFSVSPQAFFQVNTKGAEMLYSCVGDLVEAGEKCTLVDVCCGTGTIGICLANRVKKVIGVELVPEAVRDARKNAENNEVFNCSFFAGRAENILIDVLKDIDSAEIVAVVDPPRAGLHHKALGAIRNNSKIKRLVYVSCDAKAAVKNFVDLCRPSSKTARGDPFFPMKIVPVDLFPHTRGYELVFLFQRVSSEEIKKLEADELTAEADVPDDEHPDKTDVAR